MTEVSVRRAVISSVEEVGGDPLVEDGVRLYLTGWGSSMRFLDAGGVEVGALEEPLVSFSLHLPLPDSNPDSASTLAGLRDRHAAGSDLEMFLSRRLDEPARPYRTLVLRDEYGSVEVFVGE